MGRIFIVRHGQDRANAERVYNGHSDTELTELGKRQAEEAAQKIKSEGIEITYSSPLKRALNSAEIIAGKLNLTVFTDQRLMERDFGILTGKAVGDEFETRLRDSALNGKDIFLEIKGAESSTLLYERAESFLTEVRQKHDGENILIVSHGGKCRMLRAAFNNLGWQEGVINPGFEMKNGEIVELLRDYSNK